MRPFVVPASSPLFSRGNTRNRGCILGFSGALCNLTNGLGGEFAVSGKTQKFSAEIGCVIGRLRRGFHPKDLRKQSGTAAQPVVLTWRRYIEVEYRKAVMRFAIRSRLCFHKKCMYGGYLSERASMIYRQLMIFSANCPFEK